MEVYSSKDNRKPEPINTIVEIIENIARSQRSVCNNCEDCVGCDVCLFNSRYNTIPIRLTTCCGNDAIEGLIGVGGAATTYFRVECITHQRFVKLRLLSAAVVDGEVVLTGTNYTIVVDLDCVGTIQCFEPINILGCTTAAV